jgi:hypothetical protein
VRPRYENEFDLERESLIAYKLGEAWGRKLFKLPSYYPCDMAVTGGDNKIEGFVEIKCRAQSADRFDTLWLSLHKVIEIKRLAKEAGVPPYLAVGFEFTKDVRWILLSGTYPVILGGRTDRGDTQDMEPVVEFPVAKFNRL